MADVSPFSGKNDQPEMPAIRPASAPQNELLGQVIGRHYKIIEQIGEGGMSRVYRALHLLLDRPVAVKYIKSGFVNDQKSVMRFQQEARAAAALKHPNICAVNEFGIDEQGRAFLVMDLVNGTSLSERISEGRALPVDQALSTITQVCHGLSHAHAQGIVHRDLKPANIVISNEPDGTKLVKLVDFGIAKLTYRDDDNRPNLTKTGEVIGTPMYMSPEQCTGTKVDTRSDIYSIGCVMFELLTGSKPYHGQNAMEILLAHVNAAPPELPNTFPPEIRRMLRRCVEKDPQQRYQHTKELISDLEAYQFSQYSKPGNGRTTDAENSWQTSGLIGERYQIIEEIGQGGMGTVLKARHLSLNKNVAIKVLNAGRNLDELSKKRFEQEAQAGSRLSHPNLVSVFDYGFVAQEPYLVMEFIEGEGLDDIVARSGSLENMEALEIFKQLSKALQYIHKNGIVHRDLKTSNIIVQTIETERYVKLIDLGISKVLNADAESQNLTATGTVFGSPLYMSPEQCMGRSTDLRSDIYSLGCVMYECLSGRPPFEGENSLATLFKHINENPAMLRRRNSDLADQSIESIVRRCLEKDPAKRYQSAGEVLEALNSVNVETQSRSQPPRTADLAASFHPVPVKPEKTELANTFHPPKPTDSQLQSQLISARSKEAKLESGQSQKSTSTRISSGRTIESARHAEMAGKPGWHRTALVAGCVVVVSGVTLAVGMQFFNRPPGAVTTGDTKIAGDAAFKLGPSGYEDAKAQLKSALKDPALKENDDVLGKIHARLGKIAFHDKDYSGALKHYNRAIEKLKPRINDNQTDYLQSVVGAGDAASSQRKYLPAEKYFSEARKLAYEWKSPEEAAILYSSARNSINNDPSAAMYHFDQAIRAYEQAQPKRPEKIATALLDSAELRLKAGDSGDAMARIVKAKQFCTEITGGEKEFLDRRLLELEQLARSTSSPSAPERTDVKTVANPAIENLQPPSSSIPIAADNRVDSAKVELLKQETELAKLRLEAVRNSQKVVNDLASRSNASFKDVSEQLKLQNNSIAQPVSSFSPSSSFSRGLSNNSLMNAGSAKQIDSLTPAKGFVP